MSFTVSVDPTNPGQFFACCGLLELAARLWPGAEGGFAADGRSFTVEGAGTLREVLTTAKSLQFAEMSGDQEESEEEEDDSDDAPVQPIIISSPFFLRLDWWEDKSIKTWAGSMKVELIALAMCRAIDPNSADPLNRAQVVYNPLPPETGGGKKRKTKPKKREPFYFDARRGTNSHSLDVGFSANDLKLTTLAYPAVEFLCLLGLQRSRPRPAQTPRVFDYWLWTRPCCVQTLPAAVSGMLGAFNETRLRFVNGFRSGQKKHKAFRPATPLPTGA